jgi:hypothetical protein
MLSTLGGGLLLSIWVFVCCRGCWIVVRLDAVAGVLRTARALPWCCWSIRMPREAAGSLGAFISWYADRLNKEVC